jgi:serine/threonine protein kinase
VQEKTLKKEESQTSQPEYLAPEEAIGSPENSKARIYRFGMEVLEALTGKNPFEGLSEASIPFAMAAGSIIIPDGLPKHWDKLLHKCLEADANKRWNHHQIVQWYRKHIQSRSKSPTQKGIPALFLLLGITFPILGILSRSPRLEVPTLLLGMLLCIIGLGLFAFFSKQESKSHAKNPDIRKEILAFAKEDSKAYLV